jgi:hypothetical protein
MSPHQQKILNLPEHTIFPGSILAFVKNYLCNRIFHDEHVCHGAELSEIFSKFLLRGKGIWGF